jgi:hypothetical protein
MKTQGKLKMTLAASLRRLILLSALTLIGCGYTDEGWPPGGPFPSFKDEGYLPFVSEVSGPARAVAGEPVRITLQLSAILRPELLRGFSQQDKWSRVSINTLPVNATVLTLVPFIVPSAEGQTPQGPPSSEYSFDLNVTGENFRPGQTYTVRIASASISENGGMPVAYVQVAPGDTRVEAELPVVYKEISIEF